ncbi:hypothetical protein B9Z55_010956 [Caenorhabditis nigoni]|uniref:Uncharacterized protein n=1 Tax=Caenorhabditis nigoni TaxID=1611254 RepID=A0A2G5UI03_9PELO|nr:hypothetical protein B9Z55_010956 [Caenorhabditis nigoni]
MCFPNSDQDNGSSRPDDAATTTSEWPTIRSPAVTEELEEVDRRKSMFTSVEEECQEASTTLMTSRRSNSAPPHTQPPSIIERSRRATRGGAKLQGVVRQQKLENFPEV